MAYYSPRLQFLVKFTLMNRFAYLNVGRQHPLNVGFGLNERIHSALMLAGSSRTGEQAYTAEM